MTCRDAATRKLELMTSPYPGGLAKKCLSKETTLKQQKNINEWHKIALVSMLTCHFPEVEAMRVKVCMRTKNFPTQRIDAEQVNSFSHACSIFAFCKNFERFCCLWLKNSKNAISWRDGTTFG